MFAHSEVTRQGQKPWRLAVLFLFILFFIILADAAVATKPLAVDAWLQQQKLAANDTAANDYFGFGVALAGDTAVIGAPQDNDRGSAYVFVHTGSSWSQQAKLTADDAAVGDYFGWAVALDGDTAVVGAPRDYTDVTGSGAAYVFVRDGLNWSQQAKLTASDAAAGDNFGWSVALVGDTAVIGAPQYDNVGNQTGTAYVFVRTGSSWTQQAKLTANDAAAGDNFGWSVALAEDTAVIGAPQDDDDGSGSGSAYLFARSGTNWSQHAKLTANDAAAGDAFGFSVTVGNDTVVVGAWEDDSAVRSNSGSAYVFVHDGLNWSQQAKLTANDAVEFGAFGWAVALEKDVVVIGAVYPSNAAYIFSRDGTSWSQQAKLSPNDPSDENDFGNAVALFGNIVLIGAPGDDGNGSASGAAYTFMYQDDDDYNLFLPMIFNQP